MNTLNYPHLLHSMANKLGIGPVYAALITQYPQFEHWSGSHSSKLHHYGKGGLVRHTWEIIDTGFHVIPSLNLTEKINSVEFFLAALFHDTGKMYDYNYADGSGGGFWTPTSHRRLIYHVPRSALIWHDIIAKFPDLNEKYHDDVLHDILAHHGKREYGSPVAPKTHCAWLLHLCDSISARMDDADRLDIVKAPTD